jgi:alkanesulfonate monooxygenase SsuD/methylene tetrahydromethanopterin reductase-like flavin-dependent oxidoreductase (luciferase family)
MLNPAFRNPAVLAKMLATLDHITHGRVICSLGSGWLEPEYEAYDLPFYDHGERAEYAREVAQLLKELWTHPAPERVTFNGRFVQTKELPFNPAPVQKPHPPIWFGGDSDASIETVKAVADGWVTITSATQERLAELRSAPDWPTRPITIVRTTMIAVGETEDEAHAEAEALWEYLNFRSKRRDASTFEEFLEREVVGTPDQCVAKIRQLEDWGVDELFTLFRNPEHQERVAQLLLPAARAAAEPAPV